MVIFSFLFAPAIIYFINVFVFGRLHKNNLLFSCPISYEHVNNKNIKRLVKSYFLIQTFLFFSFALYITLYYKEFLREANSDSLYIYTFFLYFFVISFVSYLYFTKAVNLKVTHNLAPHNDDSDFWILGSIYNNPHNKNIFVPKRYKHLGFTINIGHPIGKLLFFILFSILIFSMFSSSMLF